MAIQVDDEAGSMAYASYSYRKSGVPNLRPEGHLQLPEQNFVALT